MPMGTRPREVTTASQDQSLKGQAGVSGQWRMPWLFCPTSYRGPRAAQELVVLHVFDLLGSFLQRESESFPTSRSPSVCRQEEL